MTGDETLLRAALQATPDAIVMMDPAGRIVFANESGHCLCDRLGGAPALGKNWTNLWEADAREEVLAAISQAVNGETARIEVSDATSSRYTNHWDILICPVPNGAGEIVALMATVRDNSVAVAHREAAKDRELQLRRQAAALRSAGLLAKLGGWEIDLKTGQVFWSEEVWTLLGAERRSISLAEGMLIYPEADRSRISALFEHARTTGERIEFETQIEKPDGSKSWIRVYGEPEYEGGVCVALRGAAQDISDVRGILEAHERAERRLNLAMELSHLHVYEIDFVNRVLVSQGAADSFFEEPLTYDRMWRDPFHGIDPRDRPRAEAAWAKAVAEGVPYCTEYRILRQDGREVWAFSTAELVRDDSGKPLRLIGALQNITERKRSERELLAARDTAEAANKAKSSFLANMSHEIRTPLNGVVAGVDMLSKMDLPPKARELVEIAGSSGATLQTLLTDILDLARIEAGELHLEVTAFHLGDLVRSVAALSRLRADEKGVAVSVSVEPGLDTVVAGDPTRTRQVLTNLLNNAVKFTSVGAVGIHARRLEDGRVQLVVEDTGIGFDEEVRASIFGRFQQADTSITRQYGGSGLGLAISHQLIELMGGVIDCVSEPKQGSKFWFELPLPPAELAQDDVGAPAPAHDGRLRVLLADDHPTNRKVVELMLEGAAEVSSVENGSDAVDLFRGGSFDVVLMDMQMPVMDGLTAVRAIRELEQLEGLAPTPIIMLTANALPEHTIASIAAGSNKHVEKPITAARLFRALDEVLSAQTEKECFAAALP
jgi:PAS domain S-box-containing protein